MVAMTMSDSGTLQDAWLRASLMNAMIMRDRRKIEEEHNIQHTISNHSIGRYMQCYVPQPSQRIVFSLRVLSHNSQVHGWHSQTKVGSIGNRSIGTLTTAT